MISRDTALRLSGLAVALVLWEIGGRMLGPALFAPPTMVLPTLWNLVTASDTLAVLGRSLLDMVAGYGVAVLIGIPLGILMGHSKLCDQLFRPWMSIFIVTSLASLVPLMILLVGSGFWFRATVVFVACFWFIVLAVYQGAQGLEQRWLDVGRAFGAHKLTLLRTVMVPSLLPYIMIGMRIGLTHAIRAMVLAEMFIVIGFGRLLHNAAFAMSTTEVLALLVLIAAVGLVGNVILHRLTLALAPWSGIIEGGDARLIGRAELR